MESPLPNEILRGSKDDFYTWMIEQKISDAWLRRRYIDQYQEFQLPKIVIPVDIRARGDGGVREWLASVVSDKMTAWRLYEKYQVEERKTTAEKRIVDRENIVIPYKNLTDRENIVMPYNLNAEPVFEPAGAEISEIDSFTNEFTGLADTMRSAMASEVPIIEGSENELMAVKQEREQLWKSALPYGSLITGHTRTSIHELLNSAGIVTPSSLNCPTPGSDRLFSPLSNGSCSEPSGGCGTETDAMNASSECTVPMTSEQTDGTPNEQK